MCPLRRCSAQLLFVAAVLSLAALAGCATDGRNMPTASVVSRAPQPEPAPPNPLFPALADNGSLSDDQAEKVIALAIAEHEMRRP
jgi:hypothetical protein